MKEKLPAITSCLPPCVRQALFRVQEGHTDFAARLSEIRLRADGYATLRLDGGCIVLPVCTTAAEVRETLASLCEDSLYAHRESMRQGYIFAFGCRVGLGGRAVLEGGRVVGMADITSLCIRLPHAVPRAADTVLDTFSALGGRGGILVYAPPGGGKTTALREFAKAASSGADARQIAVIDTRGELYDSTYPPSCRVDVLRAFDIARGIEIATRTLAPDLLLCDEIGNGEEAEAILRVQGCGLPLLASAHAGSLAELLSRPPIKLLSAHGVFAAYIGIRRMGEAFLYETHMAGEALPCCAG